MTVLKVVTLAGTQPLKQGTCLLPRMFQWAALPGENGGPRFHSNKQNQKPTLQFPQPASSSFKLAAGPKALVSQWPNEGENLSACPP